jgi:hypothetical protein
MHCIKRPFRIPLAAPFGGHHGRPRCFGVGLMDYELQNAARCCSVSGREFAPGEVYYSMLLGEGTQLKRVDFAADAWSGPMPEAVGWWKSQVPDRNSNKKHWAPNDVMLDFWDGLAELPDRQDMRYVLTLLLIRRRVFRLEEEKIGDGGHEVLAVYCPRRDTNYEIRAIVPEASRVATIQDELASLLE